MNWNRIGTWSLSIVMAVNIAATAYYFVLRVQMRSARPQASLAEGGAFPAFSGVDVRGERWVARDAPCRIIRIADDHCSYCKKDKPSYEKLVDAAHRASCEVVEIAPQADGMAYNPRPGIVQLKFVDADVGAVLFPFVTPQTIIIDREWRVRMTKRGMFDDASLKRGVELIGAYAPTLAAR